VLSRLVESPRFCAALHESEADQLLATLAATPDIAPCGTLIRFQAVACDALDHEMRRLLWANLTAMCELSPDCRAIVMQLGFMRVLLLYVDLEAAAGATTERWSVAELATLRRKALSSLLRLAPICADAFHTCDGAGVLLQFIKHAGEAAHVEAALRVISNMAVGAPAKRAWLGERHAVSIARECFESQASPQVGVEAVTGWRLDLACARRGSLSDPAGAAAAGAADAALAVHRLQGQRADLPERGLGRGGGSGAAAHA